jgi:hypothetical protein
LPAFAEEKPKPLKVFIFAGQSNMTGMARTRTLEHLKMSPETAKEYADVFDKDGKPTTLDAVYVTQWMDKEGGRLEPKFGGRQRWRLRSRIWLRDLPSQGTQRAVSHHQDFAGRKIAQLPFPSAECRQVDTTSGPSRSDQAGTRGDESPRACRAWQARHRRTIGHRKNPMPCAGGIWDSMASRARKSARSVTSIRFIILSAIHGSNSKATLSRQAI